MIKRAFTMLELVFVIAIVGILSALAIPRSNKNPLREAANQIMADIRYTQHLAMQDNKFTLQSDGTPENDWYKAYWRILFHYDTQKSKQIWRYTVFSDSGSYSGNPNSIDQIANNPRDLNKKLTSGYARQKYPNQILDKKLNLTKTYGITKVKFNSKNQTLAFDILGRPYSALQNSKSPYEKLLQEDTKISLQGNGDILNIIVFKESGYTCIEDKNNIGNCE
ncbi:putative type II secretion system protein [Campylobacter pinnipediorum subsp. caledonicus]|uniref:Putative type II secretion system protein n=1 Tax=Campylobacter pinnipediorum subsp. caledonicus TaxID=1874362 RepID=A0A1S6U6F4_9BACT|nr:prepilin-type N-terminal cleavage/methylation domain-containing protein [Campylobacter pinnipediorum]AQW87321.1 putative type II secretion system protein [Campylobacter pinnipediorum subsp. caledonicus]